MDEKDLELIRCWKCKETKRKDQFNKSRSTKTGRQSACRPCQKMYHADKKNSLTPEQEAERKRKNNASTVKYRKKMLLGLVLSSDGSVISRRTLRSNLRYRASYIRSDAKHRAKKLKIPFDITRDWVLEKLQNGKCERSGLNLDLSLSDTHRNKYGPSIDRIDNKKGYEKDNCQIVCNMYNMGKGQHTDSEFIIFCHAVANANQICDNSDT